MNGTLPATVGVVVTACAADDRLVSLLTGLNAQTLRPVDIVVVDNRPGTSAVQPLVRRLALPRVRYVAEPRQGLSRARNAGLRRSSADIVAFTDDDVQVTPSWLAELVAPFADPAVACVTGQIVACRVETDAERWFAEYGGYSKGDDVRRFTLESAHREGLFPFRAGRFGSGANAAFRRTALTAVGGFAEILGAGTPARGGEDLDIFLTVLRAGHTIVYQPSARVAHPSYPEYPQLRRQLFGYGVGLAAAMTNRFVTCRADRRAMLRTAGPAARYLLGRDSPKNRSRTSTYPTSLVVIELAGILIGPVCYLWSRLTHGPIDVIHGGGVAPMR
jgi:GT2 family glycosyltransferase